MSRAFETIFCLPQHCRYGITGDADFLPGTGGREQGKQDPPAGAVSIFIERSFLLDRG